MSHTSPTSLLILLMIYTAEAICPMDCTCRLDESGRRKTSCIQGGLVGPVPVATIDISTQVLEISSSDDNPNYITLGPIFQPLKSLEELHITMSHIQEIGKHSFWGVKTMEVLNLMKNNISHVQDHNFRGLANLKELYLNDNNIDKLTTGTFKYLTDLRILSLARNRIDELIERAFERMSKLQKLNLSGNRLAELNPQIFMDIQELRIFECRRCGLRNINPQIYNLLPHLTTLDLGENDFHYLPHDEFQDLHKLKYLWLDGNQLSVVLEKTFILQKDLEKVSFARNRLAKVTNTAFLNVTKLVELDLSYNSLYRLEPLIFHPIAESLQKLWLSGNKIPTSDIKSVLHTIGNVKHLEMAHMRFSELPFDMFHNPKLQYLNLAGNNLSSVPIEMFKSLPNLLELDLTRNQFNGFSERIMTKLERIPIVHLQKNPWGCDLCNIVPMLNRLNKTFGSNIKSLPCASPRSLLERTLSTLHESDLKWCGELEDLENDGTLTSIFKKHGLVIIIVVTSVGVLIILVGTIATVRFCCFKRTAPNFYFEEDKRNSSQTQTQETVLDATATAIFGQNGEISFKFPLEMTDRKMSVSTIDVKKECKANLPNGEL